jgi:hypothetical protein
MECVLPAAFILRFVGYFSGEHIVHTDTNTLLYKTGRELFHGTYAAMQTSLFQENLKCIRIKLDKNVIGQVHSECNISLFCIHLHSIYFIYIFIHMFRRDERVCALLTTFEVLWCVNKPGPSPCNPPPDAWCCSFCLHNPCVRVVVVHCQIQEFRLWQRNKQKIWVYRILFNVCVFVNTMNGLEIMYYITSDIDRGGLLLTCHMKQGKSLFCSRYR